MRCAIWFAAAFAGLACNMDRLQASVLTTVNLGGQSTQNFASDSLTLQSDLITPVTIPFGATTTMTIQVLDFHVGDSGSTNHDYPFALTEIVTIGGVSHTIVQTGHLLITPPEDSLTLYGGPTTTFDLGSSKVYYTPLGLTQNAFPGDIGHDFSLNVQGTLSADPVVPEPSTFALFGMMLALAAGCFFYRRQQIASVV